MVIQEILAAVQMQMGNGHYASESIYGDGHAGERIANILATCPLYTQKSMSY